MAKGYMIANLEVHDPETFAKYAQLVPATIEQYGGRYLIRGGESQAIEDGGLPRPRTVVLEFPSLEQARTWYFSEEYQPLVALRQSAAHGSATLIEGYDVS